MIEKVFVKKNNISNEIILKDYVEKNASTLKKQYLDLVTNLSTLEINKKKLEEYYIYKKNHSLWEMSLLKEKNPFKSPKIFTVIKFLACRQILNKYKNYKIDFCLFDYELQKNLKELNIKNIIFLNKIKKNSLYLKWLINFGKIFKFIIENKLNIKRSFSHYKDKEVLILSYFAHYNEEDNKFIFLTWSGIKKVFKKISWVQIFVKSEKYKNRKQLLKKKLDNNHELNFLFDFINLKILIIVIYNFFKYFFRYKFINKNIEKTKNINLRSLINIQKNDFYESLTGFHLFLNLVWIHTFEYFLSKIEKKKICIYAFENQNWEKAFITAWRNNKHGKIIAYVPTTINFWHLNYYNSIKELRKKNKIFAPDIIFSNSHHNSEELSRLNLFSVKIKEVEALRYNYLKNCRINNYYSSENKILFLGDYSDAINKSFLNFFEKYRNLNMKVKLFIKPHPASIYFHNKNTLKNYKYEFANFNITKLIKNFSKIICSNSTSAGIEFLILGKDIMIYDSTNSLDLSPFKKSKLFYLRNIDQINNFIANKQRVKKFKNFFILNKNLSNWKQNIRFV